VVSDYAFGNNFSTTKDCCHHLVEKRLPNIENTKNYLQRSKKSMTGLAVQANWGKYSKSA
jgi:hypothetical protein